MITCKVGEKEYTVNFISARALREIGMAEEMRNRIEALTQKALNGEEVHEVEKIRIEDALDVMVQWFCLLFGNQFTPEDIYDGYPVDRLVHDISLAMLAVQNQMTEVLSGFPTNPTAQGKKN